MGLVAPRMEKTLAPIGTHLAYCYQIVDLGVQVTDFEGAAGEAHQLQIAWELPGEMLNEEQPFAVWKTYTFINSPNAKLPEHVGNWRCVDYKKGGELDLEPLLGTFCMVTVGRTDTGKNSKVINVSSLPKAMESLSEATTTFNKPVWFELEDYKYEAFDLLPEFMQKKIESRLADTMKQRIADLKAAKDKEIKKAQERIDPDVPESVSFKDIFDRTDE